jgi:ribosomal protein S10
MINRNLKIQIQIKTTNIKILKNKKQMLNIFCNIFQLKHNYIPLPSKKKKITLLRSPHIHKKTWKTYIIKTLKLQYTLYIDSYYNNFESKNKLVKLNSLLKLLSTNCDIQLTYNLI